MRGPKVVLIGAGSLFFGRQFIWAMLHSGGLKNGVAALVDTDVSKLDKMVKLAQKAKAGCNSPLKLEWSCRHEDVLNGADFVIFSFANNGAIYRGIDCQIAEAYGIHMCSGDTIGPGGIFRAMRELPTILRIAKDVERICPEAWVINYTNPAAVNGLGLARYANVKSFSLCDGHQMPYVKQRYLELIQKDGGDIDKLDLTIAGVNHFNWLLDIKYDGKGVSADLRKTVESLAREEKENFNYTYGMILWDIFGRYPTIVSHTKEYMRYWQGRGILDDFPETLGIFNVDMRFKQHDAMWSEVGDYLSGDIDISQFHSKYKPDYSTDVIEAMWAGQKYPFYINTINNGAVSNLPDGAYLELLCDISMDGPVPRPAGAFPIGLRSLQAQVLDTHELTVEAIVNNDKRLLRRAMLTDPLANSIADTDAMISDMFMAERDALPQEWYM